MLIGNSSSVTNRVLTIVFATAGITFGVVALAGAGALFGLWEWPPRPWSPFGVACGAVVGAIVFFEMAILPRKWLRGRRLGATVLWMQFHIWLGIVSLPIVLIHSGFGFGNPLTAITLALFLAVIASGLWGHIMQQWLPRRMLAEVPNETIAARVDFTGSYHAGEAARIIVELTGADEGHCDEIESDHPECPVPTNPGVVTGHTASELCWFAEKLLLPYLRSGRRSRSPLTARVEVERRFAEFRELAPEAAHPALRRLETLCELRRQWDSLVRLNYWLHNWLVIHLPLSVTMTGLMMLHAVRALKYW
ncbi:MAG: hypothetical protein J0I06_02990 [Planctomycetes bacterium]|nr:hypothetical protein [Planctomycetota bacterium]